MQNRNKQQNLSRFSLGRSFLQKISLGFDHTWLVAALLFLGILVSLSPVVPHDFWWHLKVGQIIAVTRKIPTTNLFACSLPVDAPYIYASWLGEVLLYWVYSLGGLKTIIFIRNLIVVITFGIMAVEARRQCGSWKAVALALFVAAAMSASNFHVRPQMISLLFFAVVYVIINRYI